MKERVDDQIKWYSTKSRENKKWFIRLEVAAILFSVSIPFVTNFITPSTTYMKTVVGVLGVSIAFITGLLSLMKFRDNWVEYRATAEMLHRERFLFLTRSGAYSGANAFKTFVQSVEGILSSEVSNWRQNQTQDGEDEDAVENGGSLPSENQASHGQPEGKNLEESGVAKDSSAETSN